jgi:hypothetical protein
MLGTAGTSSRYNAMAEEALDREINTVEHALGESGPAGQAELEQAVHGHGWGPGRFDNALREAVEEGRVRRVFPGRYALANGDSRPPRPAATSRR